MRQRRTEGGTYQHDLGQTILPLRPGPRRQHWPERATQYGGEQLARVAIPPPASVAVPSPSPTAARVWIPVIAVPAKRTAPAPIMPKLLTPGQSFLQDENG